MSTSCLEFRNPFVRLMDGLRSRCFLDGQQFLLGTSTASTEHRFSKGDALLKEYLPGEMSLSLADSRSNTCR